MSTQKKAVAQVVTMSSKTIEKNTKATKGNVKSIEVILNEQLEEIYRKKKLADNRTYFIEKREELKRSMQELNEEIANGTFSSDRLVLRFGKRTSYRDDEYLFNISNPDVMMKFISNLNDEMNNSITKIEKELIG